MHLSLPPHGPNLRSMLKLQAKGTHRKCSRTPSWGDFNEMPLCLPHKTEPSTGGSGRVSFIILAERWLVVTTRLDVQYTGFCGMENARPS